MHLFDFLFPRRCLACGNIGKYFCDKCRRTIHIIDQRETICPICERPAISGATHPFCKTRFTIDGLTSFFHYDGIIQKAIKSLKYRSVSDLASEFVNLIPPQVVFNISRIPASPAGGSKPESRNSLFVPIPLHPSRLRYRGFNQADVLAQCFARRQAEVVAQFIARQITFRVDNTIIKRTKYTTPQVEMRDRDKRLKNMKDVFVLSHDTCNLTHDTFILFDDVFTTGATLRAAASVLKRAGVGFVWGITMAR